MELPSRNAVLVTANTALSHGLAEALQRVFGERTRVVGSLFLDASLAQNTLIVIDCATFDPGQAHFLAAAVCSGTPCALLLVNAAEEAYADLMCFPGLKGVLCSPVAARLLLRSVAALRRGELCFSRRLMSRQFEEMRAARDRPVPAAAGLTMKEWRVLALISEGHSNATVAALLHLSPHTVKTHVQKIFRKIGAANRTQAAQWSRAHLPEPLPFSHETADERLVTVA